MLQSDYFLPGEETPLPAFKIFLGKTGVGSAVQLQHFVTKCFKYSPHNPVPSNVKFQSDRPVVVGDDSQVIDHSPSFFELDSRHNLLVIGPGERLVEFDLVNFLDIERRMHESVSEFSIVGQ